MKKLLLLASILFIHSIAIHALKSIEIAEIWDGTFRTQQLNALNTLHTKNQYSVLNHNQQTNVFMIDAYDFTTLEKVETLFDSSLHQEIKEISNYFLNKTDDNLLIATNYEPIYRR